ncbi:hypothetical protein HN385_01785 [archaeon]|jgi:hypothetical protein|nr:hypothetical protein [archaeon]MBT3451560.1 hypothetical protein [archaeon]MBT6869419.1 hypothetical protein [archaeon]MBT7192582.1 hypothetical protein [archaeon]MBT7380658.1 hypothetical protein [archaeon]
MVTSTRRQFLQGSLASLVLTQVPLSLSACKEELYQRKLLSLDLDFIGLNGELNEAYKEFANHDFRVWMRFMEGFHKLKRKDESGKIIEIASFMSRDDKSLEEFIEDKNNLKIVKKRKFREFCNHIFDGSNPAIFVPTVRSIVQAYREGIRLKDLKVMDEVSYNYKLGMHEFLNSHHDLFDMMPTLKHFLKKSDFYAVAKVNIPGQRKNDFYFRNLIREYEEGDFPTVKDLNNLISCGYRDMSGSSFSLISESIKKANEGDYFYDIFEVEKTGQDSINKLIEINKGEIKVVVNDGAYTKLNNFLEHSPETYLQDEIFQSLVQIVCGTNFVDIDFIDLLINSYQSGYKANDNSFVNQAKRLYGLFFNPPKKNPDEINHKRNEKSELQSFAETLSNQGFDGSYTAQLAKRARKITSFGIEEGIKQDKIRTGEINKSHVEIKGILFPDTFSKSKLGSYIIADKKGHFFDYIRSFNNADAYSEAVKLYLQHFSNQEKQIFNAVYVAGGNHVSPLEIGLQLLEQTNVNEANYVYTDVDEDLMQEFTEALALLTDRGLFQNLEFKDQNIEEGRERKISLSYQTDSGINKSLNITYALCMTGPRTISSRYTSNADMLIDHDSGFIGETGTEFFRIAEFMLEFWKSKNPNMLFLMENDEIVNDRINGFKIASSACSYGCRSDNALYDKQGDHLGFETSHVQGFLLIKPEDNYLGMTKREVLDSVRKV